MDYRYFYRQLETDNNLDFWNPAPEFLEDLMFGASQNETSDFAPPAQLANHHAIQVAQALSPRTQGRLTAPVQMPTPTNSNRGKISGIESLAPSAVPAVSQNRISPGLFIRKDAVSSNFIGMEGYTQDRSIS
jgi:hypothetical protein